MARNQHPWTDEERQEILREAAESGLSVVEFSEQVGIHWTTLYAWRRKMLPARTRRGSKVRGEKRVGLRPAAAASAFVPVRVVPESEARLAESVAEGNGRTGPLLLAHRSGWTVLVPRGFDTDHLGQVLATVGIQC